MKTKFINRNADITNEIDNTFLFCKELSLGFRKKDLSIFSSTIFENICNELTQMNRDGLNAHGYDLIQINKEQVAEGRGSIEFSRKRTLAVKDMIQTLPAAVIQNGINPFLDAEKAKSKYFDYNSDYLKKGRDIILNGSGSTEGFNVSVYSSQGKLAETTVIEDGSWLIVIENTKIGRFELSIVITGLDGVVAQSFDTTVDVIDPDITEFSEQNPPFTADLMLMLRLEKK